MKKLLLTISLLLLIPRFCFATMSSAITFEFRSTATANMVNGGGFKTGASGTDYSTQDTAHLTITDLVIGADNTTVTSVLTPFDSNDVGNVIHITAGTGFIVGWYEVVSVSVVTATLDRACGTATSTGGTAYLGGALNIGGSLEDDFFEEISGTNAADGIVVYFYNNNSTSSVVFTPSEAISMSGAGGTTAPIKIRGYKTTRDDNPTGDSRPTIAIGTNTFGPGQNIWFENLIFTGTGGSVISLGLNNNMLLNCKVINSSNTINREAIAISATVILSNCELISYWGNAIETSATFELISCYLHDSNNGININGTAIAIHITNSIIESMVTTGILGTLSPSIGVVIRGNTLYGSENTTGIGISLGATTKHTLIENNIIYGFVTGVTHATAGQTSTYLNYNDYYNNDTPRTNVATGTNDQAVNPTFTSVTQITGTAGAFVANGSKLVDISKNFTTSGVVAGDVVYIVSGTGVTAGNYLINSISTTTNANDTLNITIPQSPGTNTAADKVYQITMGHNFAIGTNLKALGFPGAFQAGFTTGYMDIGAVQRVESAAGGGTTTVYDGNFCMDGGTGGITIDGGAGGVRIGQ